MSDVFDAKKRSEVMSLIRSKNTKAEVIVFKYLRQNNIYFQKHYKRAAGSPDIALPRKKRAVFIDGDFWHGKTLDRLIKRRGSKEDKWVIKIQKNVARDVKQRGDLIADGWQILQIWEDDLLRKRTQHEELQKIEEFLADPTKN